MYFLHNIDEADGFFVMCMWRTYSTPGEEKVQLLFLSVVLSFFTFNVFLL